ncbi:MAG: carbon-nitrogen hydrolase family protein [Campylobacteraceae bacterium]
MTKIAALQLPTLPMSEAKLDYYLRICAKNDISLVVLGEYVLNSFFKELEKIPAAMIKEQTKHKIEILKNLAKKHNLTIVAPIVVSKKEGFFKTNIRVTPQASYFYDANFLINYKHWDEEKFFVHENKEVDIPVFTHDGLRLSVIFGFDAHFDTIWQQVMKKKIDMVLIPSVGTFDSQLRWQELLKTRAFTNNVYILRVNRMGSFKDVNSSWHFYGNSFLISPNGEIEASLGDKEELLIAEIDSHSINEARKLWGFRAKLAKKELL